MAANFRVVVKNTLDQATFQVEFLWRWRSTVVFPDQAIAQGSDIALEINESFPVVSARRFNHLGRERTNFLVSVYRGRH